MAANDYFNTYSGVEFSVHEPTPDMVVAEDIAHALANQARFNGHTRLPYSVAQHSVLVARCLEPDHYPDASVPLQGLLHDAAEAYVGDVISPVKRYLPEFHGIEHRVWQAIAHKFGVSADLHPDVEREDKLVVHAEAMYLMPQVPRWVDPTVPRFVDVYRTLQRVGVWDREEAKRQFLELLEIYRVGGGQGGWHL